MPAVAPTTLSRISTADRSNEPGVNKSRLIFHVVAHASGREDMEGEKNDIEFFMMTAFFMMTGLRNRLFVLERVECKCKYKVT